MLLACRQALFVSGIGRGVALKLAECGAQVVAISRTQSELDSLKQEVTSFCKFDLRLICHSQNM